MKSIFKENDNINLYVKNLLINDELFDFKIESEN